MTTDLAPGGKVALIPGGLAGVVAGLTLLGYTIHQAWLVRLWTDWQTMSVATAILCLLLSASLYTHGRHSPLSPRFAVAAIVVGAGVLASQLLVGHDAVSIWLQGEPSNGLPLGETSPATAGCALLLGIGLVASSRSRTGGIVAIVVMVTAGLAILGYLYGVRDLYALAPYRTMSLRTALCLFALATGLLLTDRTLGVAALVFDAGMAGRTTRRQLGFLSIPPLLAFVLLRATSADVLGPGAAMAFLVALTVGPLAALILRDAQALTDLEEQRHAKTVADAKKLAAEERYHTLFTSLEIGFCIIKVAFDADGRPVDYQFLEVNPAFASQTGLIDAEGRWIRDLAPAHEQHWFDLYGSVAETGVAARFEQEADALGRHYDVSAFRIDAPEDRHVAVLFSDITERRGAEQRLQQLNETLERRVDERARELERTQDALRQSQKLEAIGQLTGGVAHDFNNLLTVILGSVQMLRRPGLAPDRHQRYIAAIDETAQRAAKLTNQLLAFARRQALHPETFDVARSLSEVMGIVTSLTGSRISIDLQAPDNSCFVCADRSQFDTAIVNMALNARDAMAGEGCIAIAYGPVSGIPGLRSHPPVVGDFIAVTVSDNGQGIDSELFDRIFEPFFTTKEVGSGTGLGLSQVFGFAKQSGGDVRVQSGQTGGATFTLYLPRLYPGALEADVPNEVDADVSGQGRCVLVVEDNEQVGEFATHALRELGYNCVLALDARSALKMLADEDSRFDIVFSDVVMPGMSGLELGQEIRRLYPRLPVLLASGYSHVLAQNGAQGFELLHKPYSIEQLSRVLRKVGVWAAKSAG